MAPTPADFSSEDSFDQALVSFPYCKNKLQKSLKGVKRSMTIRMNLLFLCNFLGYKLSQPLGRYTIFDFILD